MNLFRQIPFLRILIPFLAGILIGLQINRLVPNFILLLFLTFTILIISYYRLGQKADKTFFLISADLCLFFLGLVMVQQHNLLWKENHYSRLVKTSNEVEIYAIVSDVPSQKAKTLKVQLNMKEVRQNGETKAVQGKLIAYFKKHVFTQKIEAGQELRLLTRLVEVDEPRNPGEFNYKQFLYNRQIYHVAFVDSGQYSILSSQNGSFDILLLALKCKQWLVERLRKASLSHDAFAICSALLTGFDEEIGTDVMKAFSHSGTLHVLSVSGLHTGLIYAFLSVLYDFFDRRRKYKVVKFLILLLVLWAFAIMTGLAAPVFRSVLMLSLFAIGSIFFHNEPKNQLNLLFVSAFCLLVFNPYFITDVGFQLSFSAIMGLIVFEPYFYQLWQPKNTASVWLWKSTTASFAATLSTLPFTLFYFKQFPLWFFIANPVVVPGSFLLLLLAIPALFHWKWAIFLINFISEKLLSFINLFDKDDVAYIDSIHFRWQDVFWVSALIAFLSLAIYMRSYRQLFYSLILFLVWQITAVIEDVNLLKKQIFTVYSVNKAFAVSAKDGHRFYYSASDSSIYERYVKPHVIVLGNPNVYQKRFNVIENAFIQFVFPDKAFGFPDANTEKPTYLVLSGDYPIQEKQLLRFKHLKAVVLDQSNQFKSNVRVEKLCRKFGLLCYNTRKQGAFIVNNNEIENWR